MRLSRPERFGLSTLGRRRTPGLRREEVEAYETMTRVALTAEETGFDSLWLSDALWPEQKPRPEPQAGEVLLRVHAAGVNPLDWRHAQAC